METKEIIPVIRDTFKRMFSMLSIVSIEKRKRFWLYRFYGLTIVLVYIGFFYTMFLSDIFLFLMVMVFALGIINEQNLLALFFQGISFLLLGDINKIAVARSIDRRTWKEDYNSSEKSIVGFLIYDKYGMLARNKIYSGFLSYLGYYTMGVGPENKEWTCISEDIEAKTIEISSGIYEIEFRRSEEEEKDKKD